MYRTSCPNIRAISATPNATGPTEAAPIGPMTRYARAKGASDAKGAKGPERSAKR